MVIVFLPLVNYRLPSFIGSIHLWFLIFAISLFIRFPRIVTRKLFFVFLIYFFVMVLMKFFVWNGMTEWFALYYFWYELYAMFQGILIYLYFKESRDYDGWAKVILYTLIFIVITAVMTIVVTFVRGGTERASFFSDELVVSQLRTFGSGSYSMMIVFMALLSLLIYYYKNNKLKFVKNKYLFLLLVSLFFVAIMRFQIFTNLIYAIVIILLCFISVENRFKFMFFICGISVVLLLIPRDIYANVLFYFSDFFKGYLDEISFKFSEGANFVLYGDQNIDKDNAIQGRLERYPILKEAFINNPILGYNSLMFEEVNLIESFHVAHLYWMCKLAACGLPVFLLNIYILYYFLKEEKKYLDSTYYYYFLIATLSLLLYGVPKVIAGRETWIFFFVIAPGMYYLPLLNKKRNKNFKNVNI